MHTIISVWLRLTFAHRVVFALVECVQGALDVGFDLSGFLVSLANAIQIQVPILIQFKHIS